MARARAVEVKPDKLSSIISESQLNDKEKQAYKKFIVDEYQTPIVEYCKEKAPDCQEKAYRGQFGDGAEAFHKKYEALKKIVAKRNPHARIIRDAIEPLIAAASKRETLAAGSMPVDGGGAPAGAPSVDVSPPAAGSPGGKPPDKPPSPPADSSQIDIEKVRQHLETVKDDDENIKIRQAIRDYEGGRATEPQRELLKSLSKATPHYELGRLTLVFGLGMFIGGGSGTTRETGGGPLSKVFPVAPELSLSLLYNINKSWSVGLRGAYAVLFASTPYQPGSNSYNNGDGNGDSRTTPVHLVRAGVEAQLRVLDQLRLLAGAGVVFIRGDGLRVGFGDGEVRDYSPYGELGACYDFTRNIGACLRMQLQGNLGRTASGGSNSMFPGDTRASLVNPGAGIVNVTGGLLLEGRFDLLSGASKK